MSNSPAYPDSAGNPALRPEKVTGLNLSFQRDFSEQSSLTLETFARQLDQLIVSDIELAAVPWAAVPRYVFRPSNAGTGRIYGMSVEGEVAGRDVWKDWPRLNLKGSLMFAHSARSDLAGSEARIDDQQRWRAKLSADYTFANWPLRASLNGSWLPGSWLRTSEVRRVFNSRRAQYGADLAWTPVRTWSLRLSAENFGALRAKFVDENEVGVNFVSRTTLRNNHPRLGIYLELKE